ncbi:UNVERIFIED_CONTAM: hypothetical protein RMT77_016118 [Armadillidium vulgare]
MPLTRLKWRRITEEMAIALHETQSQTSEGVSETPSEPEPPNTITEEPFQVEEPVQIPQDMESSKSERQAMIAPGNATVLDIATPPSLTGIRKEKPTNSKVESDRETLRNPEPPNTTTEEPLQVPQTMNTTRTQREAKTATRKATPSSLTGIRKKTGKPVHSQNECDRETPRNPEPSNTTTVEPLQISQAMDIPRTKIEAKTATGKATTSSLTETRRKTRTETLSNPEPPKAMPEEPLPVFQPMVASRSQKGAKTTGKSTLSSFKGDRKKTEKNTHSQVEAERTQNAPQCSGDRSKSILSSTGKKLETSREEQNSMGKSGDAKADVPNDGRDINDGFEIDANEGASDAPGNIEMGFVIDKNDVKEDIPTDDKEINHGFEILEDPNNAYHFNIQ